MNNYPLIEIGIYVVRPPRGHTALVRMGHGQEWLLARPEDLVLVPEAVDDVVAASLPVAYLTAQITLTLAGSSRA